MDRVRLGRVLGRGARMAAQTVFEAVDAATTATPSATPAPRSNPATASFQKRNLPTSGGSMPPVRGAFRQAVRTAGAVQDSARTARQGMLAPVKRASRALTLEMSGSFFALFALSFGVAFWRSRAAWMHAGTASRAWLYLGLTAVFLYFAGTSFLRARRISRS